MITHIAEWPKAFKQQLDKRSSFAIYGTGIFCFEGDFALIDNALPIDRFRVVSIDWFRWNGEHPVWTGQTIYRPTRHD